MAWAPLKNLRGYMPKSSDTFLHPQLANTNRNKFHLPLNQDTVISDSRPRSPTDRDTIFDM